MEMSEVILNKINPDVLISIVGPQGKKTTKKSAHFKHEPGTKPKLLK